MTAARIPVVDYLAKGFGPINCARAALPTRLCNCDWAANCTNCAVAGKALGVTHIANGAYRLQPEEWATGEAAGALGLVTPEEFDAWVRPADMLGPH